jgi:hypothetical protein
MDEYLEDPHHPILENPWKYAIESLHFHAGLDGTEPYLDLHLSLDGAHRRLRFWSPQDIELEKGFFYATHGMAILDVSGRGLERLSVRVSDFEASSGSITFWARDVVDLDRVEAD